MIYFQFQNEHSRPELVRSDLVAHLAYEPGPPIVDQLVIAKDAQWNELFRLGAESPQAALEIIRMIANEAMGKSIGERLTGFVVLEDLAQPINAKHRA